MALRDSFSAEEWAVVEQAPVLAAARLAGTEKGGAFLESLAIRSVYAAAREMRGESTLLDELVEDTPSIDLADEAAAAASDERLRAALAVLKPRVAPEDLDAYKGFVLAVVQTAAEACREGGFVGIGGEEVTAREQAALDEITALLG
jgi:hypothetical protein